MSWLRSAVTKAVEVGGNNNLSRAVRSYADTVVNQATGSRNFQNYKIAAKRLEEVSVSCRGTERVQLLRRWLVSLKQIERPNEAVNSEYLDNSQPTAVMYYDPDLGGEPMNFRDVFLHSQALEGITLSLILEEPNQEELSLLQGIFRLCLMGGKEALDVTVNSVQDLSKAFSTYTEEVLAKREELLQYAQDTMAGLKINAEIVRIDSEVSNIHRKLDDMKIQLRASESEMASQKSCGMSMENLREAHEHVRLCSQLSDLLLHKKLITRSRYSPVAHNQKVDKLKVLSESLASSASKAEKRISDNRIQKEEALKFRISKASEVSQLEKEVADDIKALEQRKDELEEELKKVTTALISAHSRLRNAREERDQFEEASNQIILHFNMKDDEISRSIASHRAEAKVCNTYINFLQSTWAFQSSSAQQKEKLVNDELEKHDEYFLNWAISILDALKEESGPCISSFRMLVERLKRLDGITIIDETYDLWHTLLDQYQALETKMTTTFSLVERIKKQFSTHLHEDSRKIDEKVKDLIHALEKIKQEFESIERPTSCLDAPNTREETASNGKNPRASILRLTQPSKETPIINLPLVGHRTKKESEMREAEHLESLGISAAKSKDAEAQLSKLKLELELEDHYRANSVDFDFDMEGTIEWEFDDKVEEKPRKSI